MLVFAKKAFKRFYYGVKTKISKKCIQMGICKKAKKIVHTLRKELTFYKFFAQSYAILCKTLNIYFQYTLKTSI